MVRGHMIDLSNGVRPALRFLRSNPRLCEVIESVSISNPSYYTGMFMQDDLYSLFAVVGCLPRLQTLTIHFDDMRLPVKALTVVLEKAKALFDLGLFQVSLSGSAQDFDDMEQAVQQHVSLEGVRLVHCKRSDDDDARMMNDDEQCCSDSSISTSGSESEYDDKENSNYNIISQSTTTAADAKSKSMKRIPRIFCRSKNLQRLWLQDCPDNHIVAVAEAIQERDTQLKELSIVSSMVGDRGIESISQMIQTKNTTLEELHITLFRGHAIRVAEAVDSNSTLKKLTCDILVPHSKPSLLTDGPMRISYRNNRVSHSYSHTVIHASIKMKYINQHYSYDWLRKNIVIT